MKRTVWILNHYAGNSFFDNGGRHYCFAKYLRRAGYYPMIFCSNAQHNSEKSVFFPTSSLWEEKRQGVIGVPYIFVKSRAYRGNGKDRLLNIADFYTNVQKSAKEYAHKNGRPDIIIASSVHPLTLIAGEKLAKKFGVPCICEVRDLWPESLVIGGIIKKKSILTKIMYRGERWIYKKADSLIFTMEGGKQYILDKGWDNQINLKKVHYINNGVDLEVFNDCLTKYAFFDNDLQNKEKYKIIYTGSIREANGISRIVDVAEYIEKIGKDDYVFLIYGNGDCREDLEKECNQKEIHNIKFKGFIDKNKIPYVLSKADVLLVNYSEDYFKGEKSIFQYGQSHNKLFEYLAAQVPILYAQPASYNVVDKYKCGKTLSKEAGTQEYANAIISLCEITPKCKRQLRKNCSYAMKEYEFAHLTDKLINVIEKVL